MLGWELPPHNSGGLGVACFHLCKSLASSGVDIDFILPYRLAQPLPFMRVLSSENDMPHTQQVFEVYGSGQFSSQGLGSTHQHLENYERAAIELAKKRVFDIIHAHDWLTFRAALRIQELSNKPFIAHVHSVERDRAGGNPGNPFVREIEQTALLMADKVIAVSHHTKQMIARDYSIPEDKIEVVHNSINIDELESDDASSTYVYLDLMKRQDYKVIANIGRLTIQKGLSNLLKAAAIVIEHEPKTLFLFVGAGEQYHELIEQSAELGISRNVLFVGFQRGKAWRDAFAIADLFVLPSVSEPFGLTALEAVGYGTPVLLSKQSGVAEVLHHALRVDFWDVHKMADQITAAMRNEALGKELAENAHRELERHCWQQAADRVFSIYRQSTLEPVV